MIYETHTHFDDKAFDDDREDAIRGALAAGVGRFVNIGASMDSSRARAERVKPPAPRSFPRR